MTDVVLIFLRFAALGLAGSAFLGWSWFEQSRVGPVGAWELPILIILLIAAALIAKRPLVENGGKVIVVLLSLTNVATFGWWLVERSVMEIGGLDVGGLMLRTLAYGLVIYLLIPSRSHAAK